MDIGQEFETTKCGKIRVLETLGKKSRIVFVETGYERTASNVAIKDGKVRDPLHRTCNGVGYLGVGQYKTVHNISGKFIKDKAFGVWHNMVARAYGDKFKDKPYVKCYEDVEVSEEWHNFQNFAEWFYSQKMALSDYQLDKDLKVIGNRVYSKEACSLIPRKINNLFSGGNTKTNNLPRGVEYENNKYVVRLSKTMEDGSVGIEVVGRFYCKNEASEAYVRRKVEYMGLLGRQYVDSIDQDVFINLTSKGFELYSELVKKWNVE